MRQLYDAAYFPIVIAIWLLGALGWLPRVKPSTQNEGHERRYFYGSVWAVCIAQPVLWFLWRALPRTPTADAIKLAVFVGHPGVRRQHGPARAAASHPSHRPRRNRRVGLSGPARQRHRLAGARAR